MTIIYNRNNLINPLEEILLEITNSIVSIVKPIAKVPFVITWILGLVLLLTLGLGFTIIFYIPVLILRKQTKSEIRNMIGKIDQIPQREAMELLLKIDQIIEKLNKVTSNGNSFYVLLPIINEFKKTSGYFVEAAGKLQRIAYPNNEKQVTIDQEQQLIKIFSGWREDWMDEKMNVYN
ncbi:MAG: hypothetical protein ACK5RG_01675 [Cyclobacteriaceae bacterium]|jgi:hypothetical protein|nr:hypothetical protein [Flammeovirgaceae bacterium]